jgi:hypothetical protein
MHQAAVGELPSMYQPRRATCCGFNVAKNCIGGPALFIGIPLLVVAHMRTVVLSSAFVEHRADACLIVEVLLEWLCCIACEVSLFLLLVADPGFIAEPTQLSCRCALCKVEVEDFDHHCDVLGVCIGKGNMCYFILFLFFTSLLCLVGGAENIGYIVLSISLYRIKDVNSSRSSFAAWKTLIVEWIGSMQHVCLVLLSVAAVYGGAACIFLCLRYTYLSYQGRNSVQRRRQETLRGSLAVVFADVFHPKFSHNYRFMSADKCEVMHEEVRRVIPPKG